MTAPASSSDRNLLFGLLALQTDFVTREQLLDAMHAWMLEKQTPLGEILVRRGVMDEDDRADVEKLVGKYVRKHGDPQASLAAVRVADDVRAALAALGDEGVRASLSPPEGAPLAATTSAQEREAGPTRYVPLREHAKGSLGVVSVARDEELGREVALKQIQERFADNPGSRARFVREAEITGHLEHPGVVPVYGLGVSADGRPYYAMRFIRGESMEQDVKRFHKADEASRDPGERSLALRELLGRFVAVCDAVAYAHSRGVIHRDLKPANVMLGEFGETLVVDWGLARVMRRDDPEATTAGVPVPLTGSGSATEAGQALGTPAFMAPEQARGEHDRAGPASDVFSLGAILYALLSGKPPFAGATAAEVLEQARKGEVVPARRRKASVPRSLEAVCARALAAAPGDRYPGAKSLAAEVRRWLADEPVAAYREPVVDRARRWGRRHRSVVSAGVMLLLAGVVGLSATLWAVNHEKTQTAGQRDRAVEAERQASLNLNCTFRETIWHQTAERITASGNEEGSLNRG